MQILQDVAQVYSIAVVITNKPNSESPDELNWRINNTDIAALEGPPGCGKTTVGSALAIKLIAEGIAKRVLLVAYTNAAAN